MCTIILRSPSECGQEETSQKTETHQFVSPSRQCSSTPVGFGQGFLSKNKRDNTDFDFEVRHSRCVSNKSKCNVYTICRQTQLSTRWYANLLNVNLNYMFRPQSLAIIRLYKRKLIN